MTTPNFDGIKAGDRVRLVYEFEVTDATSTSSEWIESGQGLYRPLDIVSVEKITPPLPTEDGWYDSDRFPLSEGCFPYRLHEGKWFSALGNGVAVEPLAPFHRLGRVDS